MTLSSRLGLRPGKRYVAANVAPSATSRIICEPHRTNRCSLTIARPEALTFECTC